ncbi:MAG: ABC transporter permease [Chloroflexi bacterium]|nr:ABC transporter permease [Chloroflexota bacterium]
MATAELSPSRRRGALDVSGRRVAAVWYQLSQNTLTVVGLTLIAIVVVFAIFAPLIAPANPVSGNLLNTTQPPSSEHLMGTDQFGRDIFSRVVHGARVDLAVAGIVVSVAFVMSVVLGALAGFAGRVADELVMRAMDVVFSFPPLILAIGIAVTIQQGGMLSLVVALTVIAIPPMVRITRAEILHRKESLYVEAARAIGSSPLRVLAVHLVPNSLPPLVVQATLTFGYVILETAGLSFIGVGVKPPAPEWGIMVSEGSPYVRTGEWWISLFPGLMIFVTVLGFNLVGNGLLDVLNPRRRRQ